MLFLKAYLQDNKIAECELKDKTVLIGRSPECDLVLSDLSVSRVHAQIDIHRNFYLIRDNDSTNDTFVNDRLVQVEILSPGDAISIGKFVIKVMETLKKRGDTSKIRIQALPPEILNNASDNPGKGLTTIGRPLKVEDATNSEARSRLIRLYEIQRELGYVDSLPSLLDRSLKCMLDEMNAARGCILLVDFQKIEVAQSSEDLLPSSIANRENTHSEAGTEEEIVVPEELIHFIINNKSSTILQSSADSQGEGTAHGIAAPFLAKGRLLGMAYMEREAVEQPFNEEDLQFLTLISSLVAVNLTNTLLFDEIFAEKEKLQAVIAELTEGVLLTDTNFRIIEASTRVSSFLMEDESILGKNFFELTTRFKYSANKDLIYSEIGKGGCTLQIEEMKGDRIFNVRILPFVGKVSGFRGRIIFLGDATESRKIEEKKFEFIRNIAHKIRTPLTVIEGNLPLLHGEIPEGSSEAEILRDIEKGSSELCALVDDFAKFMEMEVHDLRSFSHIEDVDIADLSWQAINAVKEEAASKRILINNKLPGEFPRICVQPSRLLKAMTKILENAVKFSPDGGIVSLEGEQDNDILRLHVIDEGPGIPQVEQETVFKVFHQVDEKGTGDVPGLGLGLAIARQIIQEYGGDIQITSPFRSTNRGSCITFLLPLASKKNENSKRPPHHSQITL